jgi:hypothetical protein
VPLCLARNILQFLVFALIHISSSLFCSHFMTLYISSQMLNCTYIILEQVIVLSSVALIAVTLEDAGLPRYDAVSLGKRLLVFRRLVVPSSSGVKEFSSNGLLSC